MINQLRAERFKLIRNPSVYLAVLIYIIIAFLGCKVTAANPVMRQEQLNAGIFTYIGDTSVMFLISVVTAWFLGNDFTSRTIHNEIKIGCSRLSVLLSRTIIVYAAAIILHFMNFLTLAAGFWMTIGLEEDFFSAQNLMWLLVVMVQVCGIQSVTVLVVFVTRNVTAAIAISVCSSFVMCNLLRNYWTGKLFTLSCFSLAQDNSWDVLLPSLVYALLIIAVMFVITYYCFKKSDIR